MRKRIGTKTYDTEKSELICTTSDGLFLYKKKNSPQFFLFNPFGKKTSEMFFDMPPEEAEKYVPISEERNVRNSNSIVRFSNYDQSRIRKLAIKNGMSMSQFLLMLVDEYERTHE